MRATGWHNGGDPTEPAGYGLRISPADRDRYFDREWNSVVVEMDGSGEATVELSPSFWRTCSELRDPEIGKWLMAQNVAPWPKSSPPGVVVTPVDGNRFAVRVLQRHTLPGR